MPTIQQAQSLLVALGIPEAEANRTCALTLLALAGLRPLDNWSAATNAAMTVNLDIMRFLADHYGCHHEKGTRESFRKQGIHPLRAGNIIEMNRDDPRRPAKSPRTNYAIIEEALPAIRAFRTRAEKNALRHFLNSRRTLEELYQGRRFAHLVSIVIPSGAKIDLSPGTHSELIRDVCFKFGPRFAPGAEAVFVGHTASGTPFMESQRLRELGLSLSDLEKLPDVVLYHETTNRLFLIEAFTDSGPIHTMRLSQLRALTVSCIAIPVFVTAFPSVDVFQRNVKKIAWETDVWIAELADHLIHFNGDPFLPQGEPAG